MSKKLVLSNSLRKRVQDRRDQIATALSASAKELAEVRGLEAACQKLQSEHETLAATFGS